MDRCAISTPSLVLALTKHKELLTISRISLNCSSLQSTKEFRFSIGLSLSWFVAITWLLAYCSIPPLAHPLSKVAEVCEYYRNRLLVTLFLVQINRVW